MTRPGAVFSLVFISEHFRPPKIFVQLVHGASRLPLAQLLSLDAGLLSSPAQVGPYRRQFRTQQHSRRPDAAMPPATIAAARAPALGRPADSAQFLRKQRAAAEAIAADNLKLKEELMLENKFSVNPTTQTAAALIANLQEQADVYAVKARHL